jgi:hypothetical protein
MRSLPLLVVVAAVGCGDNTSAPDATTQFQTAPHTLMPRLLRHSGTVLDQVQLVTITYKNYDPTTRSTVEAFGAATPTSDWYKQAGLEYGVGAGGASTAVRLNQNAPASIDGTGIETLIDMLVTNHTLPTPPATNSQYLFMIYIPPSVTLGADLQGVLGYHQQSTASGVKFAMAVVLDDGNIADTTSTAAHELIESATDPYDPPSDGWYTDAHIPDPWALVGGQGEVGDLCDGETLIMSGTFTVQRTYSNVAAATGKSPCIPYDPDGEWFDVSADPAMMPMIAAGGSATFTLTGWSTSPIPDWKLQTFAADISDFTDAQLNAQLSATMINNGTQVMLTLHAPATATSGQNGGVYVLSGDQLRPWLVGYSVQ